MTLDNVSGQNNDDLRPGLSATAKIRTAQVNNALILPLQALVNRDPAAEAVYLKNNGKEPKNADSGASTSSGKSKSASIQGVYLVKQVSGKQRVDFHPVQTGVTGATEIEVTGGLSPGDEVVTGRFKTLRTIKSGTAVKRDTEKDTTVNTAS